MIELRAMRSATYISCLRNSRNSYKILVGKREGKRLFGRTWGRKRITLKLILCKDGVTIWTLFNWLG